METLREKREAVVSLTRIDFFDDGRKISYGKKKRYIKKHEERIYKDITRFSKEELLQIEHLLNQWIWDETLLGGFRGALEALAYHRVISDKLGRYETLKYFHIKYLGKTEKEFNEWLLEDITHRVGI